MTNGPTLRRGHVINMKLCVLASRSIASWSGCSWPRGGRWNIRRGALARPDRARPEIILHLAAELVTAALLVAGGAVLLAGGITGVALAGLGMLLYTVIASPGYFIARHQWAPAAMFAVLAILSAAAIAWLLVM